MSTPDGDHPPAAGTSVTPSGMLSFPTLMGFAHGPASNTSTTAQSGGVLQLVTPIQVRSIGVLPPGPFVPQETLFGGLIIRFVPEPSQMLLLGSGLVGLLFMAWGRGRR